MHTYYQDKLSLLQNIFGSRDVVLGDEIVTVGEKSYPIVRDVIVLLAPEHYTNFVKEELRTNRETSSSQQAHNIATDIQYSFGEEWKSYSKILAEHEKEFSRYFDIVDIDGLSEMRVCDLGCGNGRWSSFLKERCQTLILVDFSDAIFMARRNLSDAENCLFFMGDLQSLPFADNFVDFLFCLGVLHHLPSPCLGEVKKLKAYASQVLIFLYYALDNRPIYFRWILSWITMCRRLLCHVKSSNVRKLIVNLGTYGLYLPLVYAGRLLKPFHLSSHVPLYDFYHDKGIVRIQQDVYDRFFTSIEQRVTRNEILQLRDTFSEVIVSDDLPYWHFLCKR